MTLLQPSPLLDPAELAALRSRLAGDALTPSDPGYAEAARAWNLSFQQRPALLVLPETATDVAEAVVFARRLGLAVAVQATGHGLAVPAGDSALLIVTARLNQLSIDAGARTARIGAGLKWGPVLEAAQAHGLAPLLGSSPDVGAVGYTLGGGMGWLARKHGLSIDHVRSFELVTAEGTCIRVSASEHPDLFWALRGGGHGSLGVVTSMEVELVPVRMVYAGNLFYPAEMAREVIQRYREWIATAPDELTSSFSLITYPEMEAVPEPLRGQSFVIVRGCYSGELEAGADLLRFWREWREPAIDLWGELPFVRAAEISSDPVDPLPGFSSALWLTDISDEVVETLIASILPAGGPPAFLFGEVRHAGGAISAVGTDASAYSNREAQHVLQVVGIAPTPEAFQALEETWLALRQALSTHGTGRVYINFLEGEERRLRTPDAFTPTTFTRLQQVKASWDPDGIFSHGLALGR